MIRTIHVIAGFLAILLTGCVEEKESTAAYWLTTLDKNSLLIPHKITASSEGPSENAAEIRIDSSMTFQEMDGFGYTLTGGSALHLAKMSKDARSWILNELFDTDGKGIGVSYLRLSIGASDLDEKTWSYNDLATGEADPELERFSMSYDTLYLIPVLKEILKINPDIKILGSPWSAPVWMKDNGDTRGGSLKKEAYAVYAKYFVKYIQGMAEAGIIIDAVTIQNEPLHPGNNPSMYMTATDQADFIKGYLGPEFEKNGINTKIIVYDHNCDKPEYPMTILADSAASKFVDGSAFHLYGGEISALSKVHEAYPDKNLYFTEQWVGAPGDFAKEMAWHTENLIIGAPKNWARTVLEWNLAADEHQEPHTDRGGCDRCLGAITITGDEVVRNPAYYIIGHASKFVRPGSVRIGSNDDKGVIDVAYRTPGGKIVVILQNTNTADTDVSVHINNENYQLNLVAGAVATLII
ncbi:glycoside hydrolase family 30 protein [Robertkochia solimangrovi]|uniref:glycoside hydrolase family 30 protein n=1 Tax=Robertkochia solimangrovi TaxID=2213046 RepID=UPI001180C57B|nr:glycoside hydrolase family 30 beta sandwich domain-containing protein [Robertkochia solimangrovi]TRZ44465.1 glucosylceramidase [Robertkochia solimangrovi]